MVARHRQCGRAGARDGEHVRAFARCLDLGRSLGIGAVGSGGAHSAVHRLDGVVDGLPLSRRSCRMKRLGLLLAVIFTMALAACEDPSLDPQEQVGPNPVLSAPRQYLFPPMHLAPTVGWKEGETPT